MSEPTDMSVPETARLLGCSPPTVRDLISAGTLPARAVVRGSRTFQRVTKADVEDFLATRGKFPVRGRSGSDQAEVEALRAEVASLRRSREPSGAGERQGLADARADVIALKEALRLQRAVSSLQEEAHAADARANRLLVEAIRAMQDAGDLRSRALKAQDDVVGAVTGPGYISDEAGDAK